jgi:hypothetical protein
MRTVQQTRFALNTAVAVVLCTVGAPLAAQWLNNPTRGLPRNPDGTPNLSAPAPRTVEGRPDLAGVWQPEADPNGVRGGVEGIVAPRYMIDITQDLKPGEVPFRPAAEALYKERNANFRRDNPSIRCLPAGVPRLDAYTHPYKIVQTPELIVILYESHTMFRQIFVDGRELPKDPEPSWMGYSVGRWESDVLVVETVGFNDKTWLDGAGHPHSDEMHLTERFKRHDAGHMDIDIVIDDPKAYTKPLRYVQPQALLPDTDLIEFICAENAKEVFRPREGDRPVIFDRPRPGADPR